MPFANSILAGETLVRTAMQSENYQTGVAGWRLTRDGDVELNNLQARGSLIAGPVPGRHVEINTPAHLGEIALFSGNGAEVNPAVIGMVSGVPGTLEISSDSLIQLTTPITYFGVVPNRIQTDGTTVMKEGESWHGITLINSWAQVATSTPQYFKDSSGIVHVRGIISSGTATTIGNLPAGYRPTSFTWQSPAQRSGTGTAVSHINVGTNGDLVVATNFVTAQTQLSMFFSFPTL